jgi:hypothetical protein
MGTVGWFLFQVFQVWFLVAVFSPLYFMAKKTDRSQAPTTRGLLAFGYGLIWPYMIVMHFKNKGQREQEERERLAMKNRILGAKPPQPRNDGEEGSGPTSPIKNPFDD